MSLDLAPLFSWYEELPIPQWHVVESHLKQHVDPERRREAWIEVERQWLEALGPALDPSYRSIESDRFLLLIAKPDQAIDRFFEFAERCHDVLENLLPQVANLTVPGKHVVLALNNRDDYYRYISIYFPEGEHGGSGGAHVREGHSHIVVNALDLGTAHAAFAHELMHAALQHLQMPLWMEEGLTQMFEHAATGRTPLLLNTKAGERHKRYWKKYGLEPFWSGEGFFAPTRLQEVCYQLAETLMRLLMEDHRPRWFGLARGKQHKLINFLKNAKRSDAGHAAAIEHLGFDLAQLTTKFLGPGDWLPQDVYDADETEPPDEQSQPGEPESH